MKQSFKVAIFTTNGLCVRILRTRTLETQPAVLVDVEQVKHLFDFVVCDVVAHLSHHVLKLRKAGGLHYTSLTHYKLFTLSQRLKLKKYVLRKNIDLIEPVYERYVFIVSVLVSVRIYMYIS